MTNHVILIVKEEHTISYEWTSGSAAGADHSGRVPGCSGECEEEVSDGGKSLTNQDFKD